MHRALTPSARHVGRCRVPLHSFRLPSYALKKDEVGSCSAADIQSLRRLWEAHQEFIRAPIKKCALPKPTVLRQDISDPTPKARWPFPSHSSYDRPSNLLPVAVRGGIRLLSPKQMANRSVIKRRRILVGVVPVRITQPEILWNHSWILENRTTGTTSAIAKDAGCVMEPVGDPKELRGHTARTKWTCSHSGSSGLAASRTVSVLLWGPTIHFRFVPS